MRSPRNSLVLLAALLFSSMVRSNEETIYSYDALGRLKSMQVSGGAVSGAQESYDYDVAGNRNYRQTFGPANARPTSVAPPSATVTAAGANANFIINVSGSSPAGSVSIFVDGIFVGSARVSSGQARLQVAGVSNGAHTVTATYSGDAANDPSTSTFSVQVKDISWLPAVLELLQ